VTDTKIDVPKLRKMLEFVTDNPDLHNQRVWISSSDDVEDYEPTTLSNGIVVHTLPEETAWSCGTAACLAGWTALHEGWRVRYNDPENVYRDGELGNVEYVARRALGLAEWQATKLFQPLNTHWDLWRLACQFTDGAIQPPEYA
jgi:hypothetical protein